MNGQTPFAHLLVPGAVVRIQLSEEEVHHQPPPSDGVPDREPRGRQALGDGLARTTDRKCIMPFAEAKL
eukprot:CAMPEP_0170132806 /NCGR_PEP_ID=MMETSP0033_2-20121228/835_1 /TAXON_ID=195969 /ORGANISM="Dolichomastix tenuilepis, Strain CCMP3274" /LENGTH=68 /DNA_ID=CAMNT_0010368241 /DNA_START=385 /DNA_END=587 /DNA_ORIENTATION=+